MRLSAEDLVKLLPAARAKRLQIAIEDAKLAEGASSAADFFTAVVARPVDIAVGTGKSVPVLQTAMQKLLATSQVGELLQDPEWAGPDRRAIEGAIAAMAGKPPVVVVVKKKVVVAATPPPCPDDEESTAEADPAEDSADSSTFVGSDADDPLASDPERCAALGRLVDGEAELARAIRRTRDAAAESRGEGKKKVALLRDMLERLLQGRADAASLCVELLQLQFSDDGCE